MTLNFYQKKVEHFRKRLEERAAEYDAMRLACRIQGFTEFTATQANVHLRDEWTRAYVAWARARRSLEIAELEYVKHRSIDESRK